jgi:hypothetical protein
VLQRGELASDRDRIFPGILKNMREIAHNLLSVVERARRVLEAVSEENAGARRIAGGWSSKEIVGHLIDSASNNHQRFVRAALEGGLVWPGYDQNGCVRVQGFQQAPWPMLIDVWGSMNQLLAHILAHLPAEAAQARCRIGSDTEMSLEELARAYVAHLEHHLDQLGVAG